MLARYWSSREEKPTAFAGMQWTLRPLFPGPHVMNVLLFWSSDQESVEFF
jgi:hypothetical protein